MRRAILTLAVLLLAAAASWFILGRSPGEDATSDPVGRGGADGRPPDEVRLEGRGEEAVAPVEEAVPGERAGGASLRVRARRYGTAEPLAGLRVAAVDAAGRRVEGTTAADGAVVLSGLAPGEGRVEGAEPGWVAETVTVELVAGETEEIFLLLLHALAARGRVLAAVDQTPVEGALVVAAADGTVGDRGSTVAGDVWCVTRTDAEGRFALAAIPRGRAITLTVLARGYARRIQNVLRLEGGAGREVAIWLQPGGRLRGVVVDRAGGAMSRAPVYLYPDGDEILAEDPRGAWTDGVRVQAALPATSDEDGRFVVEGLTLDARYAATAYGATGLRAADIHGIVATEEAPEPEVRLVIPDPSTLVVEAQDADGNRLPRCRAVIGLHPFGWDVNIAQGAADASGRVVLSYLAAGEVSVRVEAEGFLSRTVKVVLVEGATRDLAVRLERGVSVSGVVVDGEGQPLADIAVLLDPRDDPRVHTARTDARGRFVAEGLEPGPHRVRARGEGYRTPEVHEIEAPAADLRLVCRRLGRVTGRLLLPPGSLPPERIRIGCYASTGGGWAHQLPWSDGRFEFTVDEASRILKVQGEGFAPLTREIRVGYDEVVDLGDVRLETGVTLRGVVVDPVGTPVGGATVTAGEQNGRTAVADDAGRFELAHLAPDGLWVTVEAADFLERVLRPNESELTTALRVVLSRGCLLRVRVLDAEGLSVVDADVSIGSTDVTYAGHPGDNFTVMAWEYTDEIGRVAVRLATGRYRIVASRGEKTLATAMATLEEGETTEVVLRAR